jgi:DNA-directed RNA polymerase specialized sigma24 family protein
MLARIAQRQRTTPSRNRLPTEPANCDEAAQPFRVSAPLLRAMARVRTSDAAAADDLVHDTLQEALAQAKDHAPHIDPIVWLLAIQRRLFAVRRNALAAGAGEVTDGPPGDGRSVHAALLKMPDSLREPLFLSDGCGFTCQEVAALLRCSTEGVKSLIRRARAELLEITF